MDNYRGHRSGRYRVIRATNPSPTRALRHTLTHSSPSTPPATGHRGALRSPLRLPEPAAPLRPAPGSRYRTHRRSNPHIRQPALTQRHKHGGPHAREERVTSALKSVTALTQTSALPRRWHPRRAPARRAVASTAGQECACGRRARRSGTRSLLGRRAGHPPSRRNQSESPRLTRGMIRGSRVGAAEESARAECPAVRSAVSVTQLA